ncbi:AraC family transcriptional regulator [Paenibacillus sp. YN15]|uniref:helix-turn-helix domain-containing protein n=1 Tax=Paenibacillus sp. YN15 TaxID=1742774 RepID=UPI001C660EEE|nr:AraC family transcriptional regulator [Paenibacillus sp. YN15]
MTHYEVFPGVHLLYHDFRMDRCYSHFKPIAPVFCIDHCRDGRLEWEMSDGSSFFMGAGDMQLNSRARHGGMFQLPLGYYRGITVSIFTAEASGPLSNVLDGFNVDIHALRAKFCRSIRPFVIRARLHIEHIFAELYAVPEEIRGPFLKIKVLELLLFLSAMEVPPHAEEYVYFGKEQVEKTKAIMALITSAPEKHYTLEELSARFQFPVASMTKCFKGVYGTPIYAYMKTYRINAAAMKLRKTKDSITAIALQTGYENAGKFSAAFKSVLGQTPSDYRKSVSQMD